MIIGGSMIYTDPLSRVRIECVVINRVTMWAGTQRRGIAYNVTANGRHWTARPKTLRSVDA